MNASLAEPGPSDSPLNCVSLTDFDFLNLNCQFYHKREEIPVCCFSPITVSFRFHYNNLGFDLKHFLNGFFVFCESPPSAARADRLGVGESRGFPRGPTSPCRLHPWWINLACAGGCRERRLPVSQNWGEPICHPIKGHYRGVLKFSSMGEREGTRAMCLNRNQVQARTDVYSHIPNPLFCRKKKLPAKETQAHTEPFCLKCNSKPQVVHPDFKPFLNLGESKGHRMVWIGQDLKNHLIPPPCHEQSHLH